MESFNAIKIVSRNHLAAEILISLDDETPDSRALCCHSCVLINWK